MRLTAEVKQSRVAYQQFRGKDNAGHGKSALSAWIRPQHGEIADRFGDVRFLQGRAALVFP
jgi:hypothetical protein